jgi:hypothetical protein
MKINFKEIKVYTSIKKDTTKTMDLSLLIANTIYTTVPGIVAHSLALRIYEQSEIEINEEEYHILHNVAEQFVGVVYDSIKDALINIKNKQ